MNRTILALVLSPLVTAAVTVRAEPGDNPATRPAVVTDGNGGHATSAKVAMETSFSDRKHKMTIKYGPDGSRTMIAWDMQGAELFNGPVDTDEQKAAIPDDLRGLFEEKGNNIQMHATSAAGNSDSAESSMSDGKHKMSIKYGPDGSKTAIAWDLKGTELFNGPVGTDEQKSAIPDDLRPLFDKADKDFSVSTLRVTASKSTFSNGTYQLSVKKGPDGSKTLTAFDATGLELFKGSIDTDEQKKAIPEKIRPVFEEMEKAIKPKR